MKAFFVLSLAAAASAAPTTITQRTDAPYGIKKGLGYNNGAITDVLSAPGSATWAYNWGTASNAPKFQQIPMIWGPGGDIKGALKMHADRPDNTPYILGYNEPDMTTANGGCAKTPQQAYAAWGNDMFQFANLGMKLVCPAITSYDTQTGLTGGPSGLTWLADFAALGGNNPSQFKCSAQALHWYGGGGTAQAQADAFKSYIQTASAKVNKIFGKTMPLWITEFSPTPVNNAQVMADFLNIVIPWLDSQSYVDRYAPFMADYMVANNALNAAGKAFVSAK